MTLKLFVFCSEICLLVAVYVFIRFRKSASNGSRESAFRAAPEALSDNTSPSFLGSPYSPWKESAPGTFGRNEPRYSGLPSEGVSLSWLSTLMSKSLAYFSAF